MSEEIECHLCKGKAKLQFEELSLDKGRIIIKESPYYKCSNCKEEFATSQQMAGLSEQINTKFTFQRAIINAGRSLAITLSSDIAHFYKLKKGKKIKIIPENKHTLRVMV
ncbi:MAG: hypothetical protein AB1467_00840 [Candidatus Diapherotrites archaeon]